MKMPAGKKLEMLHYMKLARAIEDRLEKKLYRQGKIVGGVYVGRGQEAIAVGTALHMRDTDVIAPTHRDMGVFLIRGIPVRKIFAQYMGRKTGVTKGKDGNMHMGDMRHGIIAFVSHLGDNVPVASGAALAFKMRGEDRVALCYNGEGATSRGDWHEGLNLASVLKLPVVFFINNNQYAYSTPQQLQMAVEHVADKAAAYGIPSEIVDGNDVLAVHESAGRAIERARAGNGPSLIEYKTFRMTGHSAHDDAGYVPPELFEEWAEKDPIVRFEKLLLEEQTTTQDAINEMNTEIENTIDEAVTWALESPYPDPGDALTGVYSSE